MHGRFGLIRGPENGTEALMEKWAVVVRAHPCTQQNLSSLWQRAVNGEAARLQTRARCSQPVGILADRDTPELNKPT